MTNALVLGGADEVFNDVKRALDLGEFHGVVTVNDVTAEWPGAIDAAVSLHGDKWPLWLRQRQLKGYAPPARVYAHADLRRSCMKVPSQITDFVDWTFPGQKDSGSSGLFAVKVALSLFDKVVVCGCPMTAEGRHYFNKRPWGGAASSRRGWKQALPHLSKVRSMSGWTKEILDKPTIQWLAEELTDEFSKPSAWNEGRRGGQGTEAGRRIA